MMRVNYEGLPGYRSENDWSDGREWLAQMENWANEYEEKNMKPDRNNSITAEETTKILLWIVPPAFKQRGKQAIGTLMDERLRRAMIFDDPPSWMTALVHTLLHIRRFFLAHLTLPRFIRHRNITDASPQGTFFMRHYDALPYYVKPTIWNRWNLGAWIRWLQGLPLPGDQGDQYSPAGYQIGAIGPNIGKSGQESMEKSIRETETRQCPMSFSRNL